MNLTEQMEALLSENFNMRADHICETLDAYKGCNVVLDADKRIYVSTSPQPEEAQVAFDKAIEISKMIVRSFLNIKNN